MRQDLIQEVADCHKIYLGDESRRFGQAESISFPTTEGEMTAVLTRMWKSQTPVTIQGGRTGLAAAAVPQGGHILNLTRMNGVLGLREAEGRFFLRVQPGVVLSQLRDNIARRTFDTKGWDADSLYAYHRFQVGAEQFFPPDPTEASATLGGMAACNASGARSYRYGPVRQHITALRLVLSSGDPLILRRGECRAKDRELLLHTEGGNTLTLTLPTYQMPRTKNASGYYIEDNMDAIDLFIGSDGTLGVVSELELALSPLPGHIWGVSCFFAHEEQSLCFVEAVRSLGDAIGAIEYFNCGVFELLRRNKEENPAFSGLPDIPRNADNAVYVELHCTCRKDAEELLYTLGQYMEAQGGHEENTWVARTQEDLDLLHFFRHAAPECVNLLIDQRRKLHPGIAKLGTDMSVPDDCLHQVIAMYRRDLKEAGLEHAVWGHIGNNHLHVNILPWNEDDFAVGKALYRHWAEAVTEMGGAVSAEHGVGKIKAEYLDVMYGPMHIREMQQLKAALDPEWILGQGTLFPVRKEASV